ncbi:MAG: NgoMIV family type II restriction endonuclease [Kiritimatiellia bacterium]
MSKKILFAEERKSLHHELVKKLVFSVSPSGLPSVADKDNKPSVAIAQLLAKKLGARTAKKLDGQKAGKLFEREICTYLSRTFPLLQHLRPGKWNIQDLGNHSKTKTSSFSQYEHLAHLMEIIDADRRMKAAVGNGYVIAPDIVISRELCEDTEINKGHAFIDDSVCCRADLRKRNGGLPILHASVSVKWTMRSDRAQNSRTEALNLIRNRKGRLPHVVVVTGEVLPSRIASLALGTGDVDCVYHFALYELLESVREFGRNDRQDVVEMLETLIDGKRLKDISDLSLDLSC